MLLRTPLRWMNLKFCWFTHSLFLLGSRHSFQNFCRPSSCS